VTARAGYMAPMATTLLYHRDPHLLTFSAVVISHATHGGRPSVCLDETAFYPEAGGQMADRGALGGLPILDVQVDDAGVVHHVVEGPLPDVGSRVDGVIDGPRRRQHMAQHTAQHMLSAALLVGHGKAETVSSRLGESGCTIDVDVPALSERSLREAEDLVNSVIDEDRVVTAFFPDEATLAALPLRRRPKVSEHIRVVVVGDMGAPFDVSPCGGTHVTRTSQIGLVRVTGVEKYKGMTRVHFAAGPKARREAFARAALLEELGRGFSSSPEEVPGQLEKLRASIKALQADKAALAGRMGTLLGEALAARAGAAAAEGRVVEVVVEVVDGADMELLRAVAARAVALSPGLAVVVAGKDADGGGNVIVSRGASSTVDCGALLKRLVAAHGGKGGGRAESAQGRLGVVDVAALTTTTAS
jgi:alanyl-tRNA synthetase